MKCLSINSNSVFLFLDYQSRLPQIAKTSIGYFNLSFCVYGYHFLDCKKKLQILIHQIAQFEVIFYFNFWTPWCDRTFFASDELSWNDLNWVAFACITARCNARNIFDKYSKYVQLHWRNESWGAINQKPLEFVRFVFFFANEKIWYGNGAKKTRRRRHRRLFSLEWLFKRDEKCDEA